MAQQHARPQASSCRKQLTRLREVYGVSFVHVLTGVVLSRPQGGKLAFGTSDLPAGRRDAVGADDCVRGGVIAWRPL